MFPTPSTVFRALVLAAAAMATGCPTGAEVAHAPHTAPDDHVVVRVHAWGGGPSGFDRTTVITDDGTLRIEGFEAARCRDGSVQPRTSVAATASLSRPALDELRTLLGSTELAKVPSAPAPARAPNVDGVAVDLRYAASGRTHTILVDGYEAAPAAFAAVVNRVDALSEGAGVRARCTP